MAMAPAENIVQTITSLKLKVPHLILLYFVVLLFLSGGNHFHSNTYKFADFSPAEFYTVDYSTNSESKPNLCPVVPEFGLDKWRILKKQTSKVQSSLSVLDLQNQKVDRVSGYSYNSSWEPTTCSPVHNVTLIVPYRDRLVQLERFITYMNVFLQLQLTSYHIIIVEQIDDKPFNRAKLFNVGFTESNKRFPSECYIFHDIDLLPENLYNVYGCTFQPRHMSAAVNSFRYLMSYETIFGGVSSLSRKQCLEVNGYSNMYFGWGAEDDDMQKRLKNKNLKINRFNKTISSYRMLPHEKASPSSSGQALYQTAVERFEYDGLNSLNYSLEYFSEQPSFTYLQVKL